MKSIELLTAMGSISEDFLAEAEASAETKPRALPRRGLLICIAAVLVLLLATTALALSFDWDARLMEYLSPGEKQLEAVSGAASFPELSVSHDGVTITVKQTLADAFGVYVLCEMTVPKDIELTDSTIWSVALLDAPAAKTDGSYRVGSGRAEILEQSANKRTVLYYQDSTAPFISGKMKLLFKDLVRYEADAETGLTKAVPVLYGQWELEWDFDYADTGRTLELNTPLGIGGSSNTITKVVISPMSFCAFIAGDDILGSIRPVINFKDGSSISYDDLDYKNKSFTYYMTNEANLQYSNRLLYRFEKMIDLDAVESVELGDVTIPIE